MATSRTTCSSAPVLPPTAGLTLACEFLLLSGRTVYSLARGRAVEKRGPDAARAKSVTYRGTSASSRPVRYEDQVVFTRYDKDGQFANSASLLARAAPTFTNVVGAVHNRFKMTTFSPGWRTIEKKYELISSRVSSSKPSSVKTCPTTRVWRGLDGKQQLQTRMADEGESVCMTQMPKDITSSKQWCQRVHHIPELAEIEGHSEGSGDISCWEQSRQKRINRPIGCIGGENML
ncbi:hypothetical protein RRG08_029881 [Elysia crispata]|uniref:Uncharacterized protein n=1 Tax=Elysia crispata TaxID=231223 RepID=A0AAE0YJN4_9GAST|nr:hypothetical protein RRG08_029881 [Elysia crispata]